MPNVEHVTLYAGTDRTLVLHARSHNNAVRDLTDRTVTWYLGKSPFYPDSPVAILTKEGVITDAEEGEFTVSLDAADTANLAGDYAHMAKATYIDGDVNVVVLGRCRIYPTLMTV